MSPGVETSHRTFPLLALLACFLAILAPKERCHVSAVHNYTGGAKGAQPARPRLIGPVHPTDHLRCFFLGFIFCPFFSFKTGSSSMIFLFFDSFYL